VMAGIFTVFVMASIGLPGLNGFVGEFLILSGTFLVHRWWAIAATLGTVLAAVYLLWMYQQVFHGKPDRESEKMRDLGWSERLIMVPLIVIIVFLGVYPKPVLDRITPSVDRLVVHVDQVTHTPIPSGIVPGLSAPTAAPGDLSGSALAAPAGFARSVLSGPSWPSSSSSPLMRGAPR